MSDHFSEIVNRGGEVAAATERFSPDSQWTVGFGLVGLGLAIAIRAGIRAEVKRAQLPAPVHVPVSAPAVPSRAEIEFHERRLAELRQLEQGDDGDGES